MAILSIKNFGSVTLLRVDSNPDGEISAPTGSLAVLSTNKDVYRNTGGTSWIKLIVGSTSSGGAAGTGAQGQIGQQGFQGVQGISRYRGIQGLTGYDGIAGITGAKGNVGSGPQGIQGTVQGSQGAPGANPFGPQGYAGHQGDDGSVAPPELMRGNRGHQGTQGEAGMSIKGPQGDPGPQGIQGYPGDNIVGPQGEQGDLGTSGAQGLTGPPGAQGSQGAQGYQGAKGNLGSRGAQGVQGGGSSSVNLTLIQTQIVTGAAVQTITFSGLNGNVDKVYLLKSKIKIAGASPSTSYTIYLKPNNSLTGLSGFTRTTYSATNTIGLSTSNPAYASSRPDTEYDIETVFYASTTSGNAERVISNKFGGYNTGLVASFHGDGFMHWNNASTNLTSIVIEGSAAGTIGVGSEFSLYKYTTGNL